MHVFVNPLLSNTVHEQPEKSDTSTVQVLGLIVELLSFFVEHHTYHIKNYILHKDLLRRILILLKSRHTFLRLSALRFMRKIITLKDEFYNRYIIRGSLFTPVIDALMTNYDRYNLLNSAILEMFEFIKLEDIKSLCIHVVEKYGTTLDKITYVKTFAALKVRYDQHQDRLRERSSIEPCTSILRPVNRFRRDERALEEDEEMWFNDDEDDMDESNPVLGDTESESNSIQQMISETSEDIQDTVTDDPSIDRVMHQDKIKELGVVGPVVSTGATAQPLNGDSGEPEDKPQTPPPQDEGKENKATLIEPAQNMIMEVDKKEESVGVVGAVLAPLVDYDSDSEEESGSETDR